jgi:hypothetical protein
MAVIADELIDAVGILFKGSGNEVAVPLDKIAAAIDNAVMPVDDIGVNALAADHDVVSCATIKSIISITADQKICLAAAGKGVTTGSAQHKGSVSSGCGVHGLGAGLDKPVSEVGELLGDYVLYVRGEGIQVILEVHRITFDISQGGRNIIAIKADTAGNISIVKQEFRR